MCIDIEQRVIILIISKIIYKTLIVHFQLLAGCANHRRVGSVEFIDRRHANRYLEQRRVAQRSYVYGKRNYFIEFRSLAVNDWSTSKIHVLTLIWNQNFFSTTQGLCAHVHAYVYNVTNDWIPIRCYEDNSLNKLIDIMYYSVHVIRIYLYY